MNKTVYESYNPTFLNIAEQALKDNNIPCSVIGADAGLGGAYLARINVPEEYAEQAIEIIKNVTE